MSLLDRLVHKPPYHEGGDSGALSSAQVYGALFEMHRGQKTKTEVMTALGLEIGTADETELDAVIALYQAHADKEKFANDFQVVVSMAQARIFGYDNKATLNARLQVI